MGRGQRASSARQYEWMKRLFLLGRRLLSRQPPQFTIFLHQFIDAAPGAFLDFGSLGGKDSYSFARKP
jgi:hypothetical protein